MVSLGVCPEPNGNERRQAFAGKTANFVMLLDKSGSTATHSLAYKHVSLSAQWAKMFFFYVMAPLKFSNVFGKFETF